MLCPAGITANKTLRIAAVHGMMFGQSMRLFYYGTGYCARPMCLFGNFELSRYSHIVFVSASTVDESGLVVAHPPRPTARCTGLPAITGVPDCLVLPPLPVLVLALGCAAACFRDNASFNASVNFLGSDGSVILLFTSLAHSITKISLCVNGFCKN